MGEAGVPSISLHPKKREIFYDRQRGFNYAVDPSAETYGYGSGGIGRWNDAMTTASMDTAFWAEKEARE